MCDAPRAAQCGFQDAATPVMLAVVGLHHELSYVLLFVLILVAYLLLRCLHAGFASLQPRFFEEHTVLELLWTVLPALVLMLVAVPSFALLYSVDDLASPGLTVVVIGAQ